MCRLLVKELNIMSTIELAALIAGFLMAVARLSRVAAPLWNYGPVWVQPLLVTLPLALTELAGRFGAVHTKLDLTEAGLVAALTLFAAVRGAIHPKAVALVLLCFVSFSTSACSMFRSPPPETAAREAYKAAKTACRLYDLAPAERHTAEMDRTCRSLRLVCE
jgi:hypothetical protein